MNDIVENISAAKELDIPICQDCGMAVVFVEIGQDVHFIGGNFEEAVNEGVRRGYAEGSVLSRHDRGNETSLQRSLGRGSKPLNKNRIGRDWLKSLSLSK